MQKVPTMMVYDSDILTYLCILMRYKYYVFSCIQSLFKDGSNSILLTVDVVFFVFGITGIQYLANQKL